MSLKADKAVEHLHARVFQIAGPSDVRILVKAGFQLHNCSDFLLFRGGNQCRHDKRMLISAVKRLLDRKHSRVLGCRFDERNHGVIGVERMVQQDVVATQFLK